jgi:hypothetical protein
LLGVLSSTLDPLKKLGCDPATGLKGLGYAEGLRKVRVRVRAYNTVCYHNVGVRVRVRVRELFHLKRSKVYDVKL